MRAFEIGQKIQGLRDVAQALQRQSGTFLASQPGSNLLVVCEEGHSIKSIRSVGSSVPAIPVAFTGTWDIEKLNESTEVPDVMGDEKQVSRR